MAKITSDTVNGWPVMSPLGKKESAVLAQNLSEGEPILGLVIGNFGQAIVATPQKVLVIKTGVMSGQSFGHKASSFDYRNIVGVEVRVGFAQGEFEILSGGLVNNQGNSVRSKVKMAEQPNGLVFGKTEVDLFNAMATKIREFANAAHQQNGTQAAQPPQSDQPAAHPSISAIKQLSELHAAGILTDEEFNTKKAELLGSM